MLTVIKSIALLFVFFVGVCINSVSWANENLTKKNDINTLRKSLKHKLKYKIGNQVYTMTDDDISVLDLIHLQYYNEALKKQPKSLIVKPDIVWFEENIEGRYTIFDSLAFDRYKKGKTSPLISKNIIRKTNNLSLYLAASTDEDGNSQTLGLYSGIRIYRLRANKEYSKKIDIIENYYQIINQLRTLKITEIKENFAMSSIGVSFGLILKKDFSEEVSELYFLKRNNHDFIVIEPKKRKFYHLKDEKGLLLKTFGEILEK